MSKEEESKVVNIFSKKSFEGETSAEEGSDNLFEDNAELLKFVEDFLEIAPPVKEVSGIIMFLPSMGDDGVASFSTLASISEKDIMSTIGCIERFKQSLINSLG